MPTNYIYQPDPDEASRQNCRFLLAKTASTHHQVSLSEEDGSFGIYMAKPNPQDKLTIICHGSEDGSRLAGRAPEDLAREICGTEFAKVGKIVLLACGTAAGSASQKFERTMRERGFRGVVVGYKLPVGVKQSGKRQIDLDLPGVGSSWRNVTAAEKEVFRG